MAKVTGPLHSSEARGSVGSLTYNTWRGIATVKTRQAPAYSPGGPREAQKNLVQAAAVEWRSLTDQQRSRWRDFAEAHPLPDWSGSPKRLAGYHWYVKCRTYQQINGSGPFYTPPPEFISLPLPGLDLFVGSLWCACSWEPTEDPGYLTSFVHIWTTDGISPGRNPTLHAAHLVVHPDYTQDTINWPRVGQGRFHVWARIVDQYGFPYEWVTAEPKDYP